MSTYTAATEADIKEMLEAIGVDSIDALFADIPQGLRSERPLSLEGGRSEQEVYEELRALARRNVSTEDEISFLGAGMYDHYVPALVDSIILRSEFLTPYTPYQPEISQGGLQAMFEYQTAISELTGLPVSNASVYEGPSAVGAAGYVAKLANGRGRFVISRGVHPHSRETLATLARGYGVEVVEAPLEDGLTVLPELDETVSAVIVQQPNFLGAVEDLEAIAGAARAAGALTICACDPLPLALLRSPGECGVDIAVGEGQTLGNRLDFGGPSFGFFAASEALMRRMPGRIAGETRDVDGRRGFVLTLQTREQHIRREKATSNICTAQALNALAGVIYLSWLGRAGLVELAELMLQRTAYARERLAAIEGVELLHEQPVVREFAIRLHAPVERVVERCREQRREPWLCAWPRLPRTSRRTAGGHHRAADAARHRPSRRGARRGGSGRACRRSRGSSRIVKSFIAAADDELTIYERSKPGRRAFVAPELDVPARELDELLPRELRRREPPRLPEVSEPEIVRHYNRLSKRNFDLDTGFYPLGSCTMKHNPKLHERLAALPGNAKLHPLQDPRHAQGALELMWRLKHALSEIAGLPHVSLQPSAGSHGELAGVLLTRAYHEDRGEQRTKVLTPDTAHGTNPATVTMAGYEVVKVGTDQHGNVDLDDLRAKADEDVACLMLTNPSTLGLFEPGIEEIAKIVHGVGATLYYDGANLNAIMGISRPGDMGFDIVHFNLHKSFTQPHGGGGPGAGPIAVSDRIEPYLPRPQVVRREPRAGNGSSEAFYDLDFDRPKSIGRLRGFQGNYGVFVRAYAYIRSLGAEGLREVSELAVLNANYLLARLAEKGIAEYLPAAYERICMHEFVLSGAPMKRELEIKTLDLAKRLLDYGIHPPTIYFPLIVEESLLIEPTETETKETLDRFVEVIAEILREAREDPELVRTAPHNTPVRRLDEAGAARRPIVRQAL